jgi:hypothetical protein
VIYDLNKNIRPSLQAETDGCGQALKFSFIISNLIKEGAVRIEKGNQTLIRDFIFWFALTHRLLNNLKYPKD